MTVHVRTAEPRDADLYDRLQRAEFQWTLAGDAAAHRQVVEALIARPLDGTRQLVAEVDGRFAGYAVVQPFAPVVDGVEQPHPEGVLALLPQIAVVPSRRGHGVGAALLAAAEVAADELGFGVLVAHIPEPRREWYSDREWMVLPPRVGFAWIEPPSPRNAALLPGSAPAEVVRVHTPFFEYVPMCEHGYDSIAVRMLPRRSRLIAASAFKVSNDHGETVRGAARSLMESLDGHPEAFARVPDQSKAMLRLTSMTRGEHLALRDRMRHQRDQAAPRD